MAVRFDATGDDLDRSTNLIDYNSNYTIMGYFFVSVDTGAMTFLSVTSTSLNFDAFGLQTANELRGLVRSGAAPTTVNGTTLNIGQWYHIAMVRTAVDNLDFYLDGVLDFSNTLTTSGRASSTLETVGSNISNGAPMNGRVFNIKEWSTNLTAAEVRTEKNAIRPIRLANLVNFTPILAGTTGRIRAYNGVDWTANGTLADEDPPAVGWGNGAILSPVVAAVVAGEPLSSFYNLPQRIVKSRHV